MLGEIQLVLGGEWTTTIEAESPRPLYRLRRGVLDALSERPDELLEPLVWLTAAAWGARSWRRYSPASSARSARGAPELEKKAQWVTVRRGEALFRQGDPADGWYIVMSGRLKVLRRDELGDLKTLGEIGRGEAWGSCRC